MKIILPPKSYVRYSSSSLSLQVIQTFGALLALLLENLNLEDFRKSSYSLLALVLLNNISTLS